VNSKESPRCRSNGTSVSVGAKGSFEGRDRSGDWGKDRKGLRNRETIGMSSSKKREDRKVMRASYVKRKTEYNKSEKKTRLAHKSLAKKGPKTRVLFADKRGLILGGDQFSIVKRGRAQTGRGNQRS